MKVVGDVRVTAKPIVGWWARIRFAWCVLRGRTFTLDMRDANVDILGRE